MSFTWNSTHSLPLLSLFSASNHLPEDDALKALFDRFLLRCHVDHLPREAMPRLLTAGWALERPQQLNATVTSDDLRALAARIHDVDLSPVLERYTDLVFRVRDLGVAFSDRRAVKVQKLIAASALLCDRAQANGSDLWVLRYVWDRAEQIAPLSALVNGVLKIQSDANKNEPRHALAAVPERADAEVLARQLDGLESEAQSAGKSLSELARLREQASGISDRAAWVADGAARKHLLDRAAKLLQRIGA